MKRTLLLDRLDKATSKAAEFAIQRGVPISDNNKGTWVGNTLIKKNNKGFYDVLSLGSKILFEDIMVFDVATIIAQRYSSGELKTVSKVLALENIYAKHHTDMMHYLHCIRAAKGKKQYDTMAILEDKFQISELRARSIRDSISIFKRVK